MRGPTFTLSTSMWARNRPVSTSAPRSRSASTNAVDQRLGDLGRGGRGPGGPAALAGVAVEGELADHQQRRAEVGGGLSSSRMRSSCTLRAIVSAQSPRVSVWVTPTQHQQAVGDRADHLAVDGRPTPGSPSAPAPACRSYDAHAGHAGCRARPGGPRAGRRRRRAPSAGVVVRRGQHGELVAQRHGAVARRRRGPARPGRPPRSSAGRRAGVSTCRSTVPVRRRRGVGLLAQPQPGRRRYAGVEQRVARARSQSCRSNQSPITRARAAPRPAGAGPRPVPPGRRGRRRAA